MALTRRRFAQEFEVELCREVISTSRTIKNRLSRVWLGAGNFAQLASQIS
jgi:hypothetical protein